MFSAPGAIKQWEYIPVAEDVVYDVEKNTIVLATNLGALQTAFKGTFSWDAQRHSMDFSFNEVNVKLFSWEFTRKLKGSLKTYTFFAVRDRCACARSSSGPVTLLHRLV